MKRNNLPGDGKSKAKMLFIFSGRIHSVETAKNIFSGSFRNAWTIIGNRKAELAVCLLAGLCFLYENSLSVFLEGSYPDQDRAEEILKTVRKQENKTDICFYWDGGFMKAEELFGTENAAGKNPFF